MNITLVLKATFSEAIPVYSTALVLADLGHSLRVVCDGCNADQQGELERRGVRIDQLHSGDGICARGVVGKIRRWLRFRRMAWEAIKGGNADLYWFGSADTVMALGRGVKSLPYVFLVRELYDTRYFYRFCLGYFMRYARVVIVPERTRGQIFRAWYHLRYNPIVIPNKPYHHPRTRKLPITDQKAAEAFAKIPAGSKIVFYQGGVSDRRDIKPIARLIEQIGKPWVLAIQTRDSSLNDPYYLDLKKNYKFYPIPFVSVPRHLEVTSNVDVGLVTYTHLQMNNEFCAPNKIWEYSGFGIPMIANDVMGLMDTVGRYQAGICPNLDDIDADELRVAFKRLIDEGEQFSANATRLFESVDVPALVTECIETAMRRSANPAARM